MNFYTNIVNTLRTIHYSTDLPVWIFDKDEVKFNLPKNTNTAESILNERFILPKYKKDLTNIQIVRNIYKETYLIKVFNKDITIAFGPFINESIEIGSLTNMVRDGVISFHQKNNMLNYYHECLILNDVKLNYIVQLIDKFDIADNLNESILKVESNEIDDDMFQKQKNEYRRNEFLHTPFEIESEISKFISMGDSDKAIRVLQEVNLTPHAKLASSTIRSYKNSMICSCAFMTRAAISGGVNSDEAFTLSDTYINHIEDIDDIKELQQIEIKMVEGFANMVRTIKTSTYSSSILHVIYYIENHLCEDLDAKILAKEAYLNPSYLSSLFHKETGVTLSDWITRKRIEEASYHVLNSKEDIADIAFFYKFCSQSYFVQCFKKIKGVTPGEYRRKGK